MIRWGQPTGVPAELGEKAFEEIRFKIEQEMLENRRQDDGAFGWRDLI